MKWKPYAKYNDSGVEWLGEVPEHWRTVAIKWLSPVFRGASPRPIEDPKYFDDEGEYAWVRISDVTAAGPYLRETTQRLSDLGSSLSVKLQPGQLFLSIAATVGQPCITATKACIHDGFVYFPRLKEHPRFLYYLFEAGEAYRGLGKLGTQLNLNTDSVGAIRIGLPPPREADAVVAFLDRETAQIDTLIAKQERLIELLQEKRQALISHVVTKGLNPDAPMKRSGVEWLGDIPARWAITRLAFCSSGIRTGPFGSDLHAEDYVEDGRPVINPANILSGQIVPDPKCTVDEETAYRLSSHWLTRGDIIVGRRGEMGRCAVVGPEECGWICATGCLRISPNQSVALPDFLQLVIQSQRVREWLSLQSVGSTMENLNASILGRVPLPLPPIVEQAAILARIARQSASIDDLIGKASTAIALLREHRTALISAAVTGRIDVREVHQAAHA